MKWTGELDDTVQTLTGVDGCGNVLRAPGGWSAWAERPSSEGIPKALPGSPFKTAQAAREAVQREFA